MAALVVLNLIFFFFLLGYNTMSFSTPDSVSLGARPGSNFFQE